MQNITKYHIIVISIWVFRLLSSSIESYRFEPNTMTLTNYSECPGSENHVVHINYTINRIARNRYVVNGELLFKEYLAAPLEVFIVQLKVNFNLCAK